MTSQTEGHPLIGSLVLCENKCVDICVHDVLQLLMYIYNLFCGTAVQTKPSGYNGLPASVFSLPHFLTMFTSNLPHV